MCKAIAVHLGPRYIGLSSNEVEVKHLVENVYQAHNFPQCLGAIDCTHIDIRQPSLNSTDFVNKKHRYSLNVQAVCN